jgi:hypothetical protein
MVTKANGNKRNVKQLNGTTKWQDAMTNETETFKPPIHVGIILFNGNKKAIWALLHIVIFVTKLVLSL